MSDEWKLKVTIGCATMSAKFPNQSEAETVLICWVELEAETCLSGNLEERYAAARRWIEGQGGVVEITDNGKYP